MSHWGGCIFLLLYSGKLNITSLLQTTQKANEFHHTVYSVLHTGRQQGGTTWVCTRSQTQLMWLQEIMNLQQHNAEYLTTESTFTLTSITGPGSSKAVQVCLCLSANAVERCPEMCSAAMKFCKHNCPAMLLTTVQHPRYRSFCCYTRWYLSATDLANLGGQQPPQ